MERVSKLSALVRRLPGWFWFPGLCFLLFCHLAHGRFWWQELVCSFTPYWTPFVLVGLVVTVYRYRIGRLRLSRFILMAGLQTWIVFLVFNIARPYLYFEKWPVVTGERVTQLGVLVAPFLFEGPVADRLDVVIRNYRPDLMVVIGNQNANSVQSVELKAFPFIEQHSLAEGVGIRMFSKHRILDELPGGVGFAALPAMYKKLRLPDGELLEVGALSLSPLESQEAFEDNKLTSRRIATLVRNSAQHRIVVGSFFGSPFSKIVSMYVRQARLRSVMFGRGFQSTWDMQSPILRLPVDHAFVSKHLRVEEVALFDVPDSRHQGMFFKVIVEPRALARGAPTVKPEVPRFNSVETKKP